MIGRVLLTALVAGLAGAVVYSLIHFTVLQPLILEAEIYESHGHQGTLAPQWQRVGLTLLANLVIACGYALLLTGAMVLAPARAMAEGAPKGFLWGMAGFASFTLAPAVGLPPELPGMHAADLQARQLWWLLTVAATAAGLWASLLARHPFIRALGLGLLVLPHLLGAPQPIGAEPEGSTVPGEVSAAFAARSLVAAFLLWSVVGIASGTLTAKLAKAAPRRGP
jgi:cobalt transporter subunit CbtA